MKLLVTGGAGFIGSFLSEALISAGHSVVSLDDLSTGSDKNLINLTGKPGFKFVNGTMMDENLVRDLMADVDGVFHLGAALGVKRILERPYESLVTNMHGTEIVLKAAAAKKVRTFLASTSEIYGDPEVHPQKESYWGRVNPIGIRSCYDEGKRCAETLFFDYHRQRSIKIKVARIFNTYGPRMHPSDGRVISNLMMQALSNHPITVYGDGSQSRTFSAVSDVVAALNKLLKSDSTIGEVFNVGGNQLITIKALAEKVIKLTNSNSKIEYKTYKEVYGADFEEPNSRVPDINKIKSAIGWSPKKGLDEIITELATHMKK